MKKLLTGLMLAAGLSFTAHSALAVSNPDCEVDLVPSNYKLVCMDAHNPNTGGGPGISIYSGSSTPSANFPVVTTFTYNGVSETPSQWVYNGSTSTYFNGGPFAGIYTLDATVWSNCDSSSLNVICVHSAANHDLLEWYSNVAGYYFVGTDQSG